MAARRGSRISEWLSGSRNKRLSLAAVPVTEDNIPGTPLPEVRRNSINSIIRGIKMYPMMHHFRIPRDIRRGSYQHHKEYNEPLFLYLLNILSYTSSKQEREDKMLYCILLLKITKTALFDGILRRKSLVNVQCTTSDSIILSLF